MTKEEAFLLEEKHNKWENKIITQKFDKSIWIIHKIHARKINDDEYGVYVFVYDKGLNISTEKTLFDFIRLFNPPPDI